MYNQKGRATNSSNISYGPSQITLINTVSSTVLSIVSSKLLYFHFTSLHMNKTSEFEIQDCIFPSHIKSFLHQIIF